ncbi:hypothetical protein SETIT_4G148300v2 [Setaria italica]|uniref:Uncharacterized protein n=1 Tax=Setaria italica TaxID=4555 RepID=A0A368QUC9_SETIT|nr:hypothetical protein SETIT_4G148300v2 [Setaria italica]
MAAAGWWPSRQPHVAAGGAFVRNHRDLRAEMLLALWLDGDAMCGRLWCLLVLMRWRWRRGTTKFAGCGADVLLELKLEGVLSGGGHSGSLVAYCLVGLLLAAWRERRRGCRRGEEQ